MNMKAKLKVVSVEKGEGWEQLKFGAVAAKQYPSDGSDENNTYAKWTPTAQLSMTITNPSLHGQFEPGQEFYVDFTPAESA